MRYLLGLLMLVLTGCTVTEKVVTKVGTNLLDVTTATFTGIVKKEDGTLLCRYQNGFETILRERKGYCPLELKLQFEEVTSYEDKEEGQ